MSILNTSIKIKDLLLSNRLVMPPMASGKSEKDGTVVPKLCEYYAEKTHGGYLGLVITEHAYVSMDGKAHEGQLSISKDSDIPGLKQLVDIVHKNGSKVMAQISHAGGAAKSQVTGCEVIAASSVKLCRSGIPDQCPKEMTLEDIRRVVRDFGEAATRAKAAGFDGVEIHAAHGYLLNQFYSPLTNHRTDTYCGGSLTGRLRLHLEIIQEISRSVGKEYPLAIRLGACDYMPGGTTVEDSVQAARILEKAGIYLLDISGGLCGPNCPKSTEQGYFKELSASIKQQISIPVMLTGGVATAEGAEALLQARAADLIGIGRALLKNSNWAEKAITSLEGDVHCDKGHYCP